MIIISAFGFCPGFCTDWNIQLLRFISIRLPFEGLHWLLPFQVTLIEAQQSQVVKVFDALLWNRRIGQASIAPSILGHIHTDQSAIILCPESSNSDYPRPDLNHDPKVLFLNSQNCPFTMKSSNNWPTYLSILHKSIRLAIELPIWIWMKRVQWNVIKSVLISRQLNNSLINW